MRYNMSNSPFYDGTSLLSRKDLQGRTPELFLTCGNRTSGKTTWFSRFVTKKFLDGQGQFMLVYRYETEMDDIAQAFFGEISWLFFEGHVFSSKEMMRGAYHKLLCDNEVCGYAAALSTCNKLKRYSHLFAGVNRMFMDEFQPEDGRYLKDEVGKLLSLHTTVARGGGKMVRYVPVYMVSNAVTMLNPYYNVLDIASRLDTKTKFLRGNGFVLEQNYNENAAAAQQQSLFNQAFSKSHYTEYASQNVYLHDDAVFIERITEDCDYYATIAYDKKMYGLRRTESGLMYCSDRPDLKFPFIISVTLGDHGTGRVLCQKNSFIIPDLKWYFNQGLFRFRNIECKQAVIKMLSITC